MALVQTDLKRLVAYSSVSHMGFVILAIAAATPDALGAALVAMVSHGFVAGLLFLLVGSLYDRDAHARDSRDSADSGAVMPVWGVAFTFGALASLGLPGLSGFPGEFATVLESFRVFGWWTAVGDDRARSRCRLQSARGARLRPGTSGRVHPTAGPGRP